MTARLLQPDRAALEITHSNLRNKIALDDMLKVPSLRALLIAAARQHMISRARFDAKRHQANDID